MGDIRLSGLASQAARSVCNGIRHLEGLVSLRFGHGYQSEHIAFCWCPSTNLGIMPEHGH